MSRRDLPAGLRPAHEQALVDEAVQRVEVGADTASAASRAPPPSAATEKAPKQTLAATRATSGLRRYMRQPHANAITRLRAVTARHGRRWVQCVVAAAQRVMLRRSRSGPPD